MRRSVMISAPFAILAVSFGGASRAAAADMEARSRIDAVTIYPDAASVTRVMDVDLPAGATTLFVRGLPQAIDPDSLRVSGAGGGKITIGAVEARLAAPEIKPDTGVEARLKALRADHEAWRATFTALTAKQDMILRYSRMTPDKLSDGAKPLDVAQWTNAFDTIGNALAKVSDSLREAQARINEINAQIDMLEVARTPPEPRQPLRDIAIIVETATATKGNISLTYNIAGAQWLPSYDVSLDTSGASPKKTVQLSRRASVTQTTGEDWSDIALTVSTTRTARGAAAPDVFATPVQLAPEQQAPVPLARSSSLARRQSGVIPEGFKAGTAPSDNYDKIGLQQTNLEANAYQATFAVAGRISAPSNGVAKTLELGVHRYEAELFIKTAPALQQAAFLETHLTNDEAAPLLGGQMTIRRDGVFVGAGMLADVAPGDGFDIGFGVDDSIKVARAMIKRKENDPPPSGFKSDSREFKTTVRNLHDFPVRINLVDRIPYSENTALTVDLLGQTTPPTTKQVADRRGVMSWTFDLKPQQENETKLAWRMRWPAGQNIVLEQPQTFRSMGSGNF